MFRFMTINFFGQLILRIKYIVPTGLACNCQHNYRGMVPLGPDAFSRWNHLNGVL